MNNHFIIHILFKKNEFTLDNELNEELFYVSIMKDTKGKNVKDYNHFLFLSILITILLYLFVI